MPTLWSETQAGRSGSVLTARPESARPPQGQRTGAPPHTPASLPDLRVDSSGVDKAARSAALWGVRVCAGVHFTPVGDALTKCACDGPSRGWTRLTGRTKSSLWG